MSKDSKPMLNLRRPLPKPDQLLELNCKFRRAVDPSLQERTRSSYEYVLERCANSLCANYSAYAFWLVLTLAWCKRHPEELVNLCLPGEKPGKPAKEPPPDPLECAAFSYQLSRALNEQERREREKHTPVDDSAGCNPIF